SRKGFDSAHGGCPSPILGDNLLCSLPIPDDRSPTTYGQIAFNGSGVATIVESLTRGRIAGTDGAHLDPDLRRNATARTRGWRPIFGQAGAAQSHLARHRVGRGDLFLFFGSFRRAEKCGNAFRFVRSEPRLHVIFGWLQVGEVRPVTNALAVEIPWAEPHPHLSEPDRYKSNTLYLASERLSSLDPGSPGGGIFEQLRKELILTETDPYSGCATWILPRWIHPRRRTPLSYHSRLNRWTDRESSVRLRSAYPGQEFVLDLDEYPEAYDWLCGIFRQSKPA
ncbi:MAG TPA: hypothetical protein VEO55_06695, partial [Candidatus Dormibacteraeota bacterium]|nr:hypothetical protein [Candidatus Dormibacteraeota bacterium]